MIDEHLPKRDNNILKTSRSHIASEVTDLEKKFKKYNDTPEHFEERNSRLESNL